MMSIHKDMSFKKRLWILILFSILPLCSVAQEATECPSLTLNQRQLCDLELLLNEGFSPLEGFMDRNTYESVVNDMRLPDGMIWPMPIVLDVPEKSFKKIAGAKKIALRDPEGVILAYMEVSDTWKPDKTIEAEKVYGTASIEHPGVDYLLNQAGDYYIGGELTLVSMPKHYDFTNLRLTPKELKALFKEKGYQKVVAFQTRNPMHRAHLELTKRGGQEIGAHILLQPAVGMTKPGDIDYFTRVKCYQKLIPYYSEGSVTLSLLPISMRMAGPREAVWHAIIRKNYGCTHFIVGRDHAGPGKNSQGVDFYHPYAAQDLAKKYEKEIGIEIVPFKEMVYVKEDRNYQQVDEVRLNKTAMTISGTQLRQALRDGQDIPEWFSFPEVVEELRKVYPPRTKQGFTLFFTGLSGAGKSTIANGVAVKLMELQDRHVTLLDGDIIRAHLSSELGFSKEHRSLNVRRVGYVASEISKNGGLAICALIAPYEADRRYNKAMINSSGGYIEVYVNTSLEECENRDIKGLYKMAREGKLQGFTGIDDPYEAPQNPDIVIDTTQCSVEEAIAQILAYLRNENYLE